MTLILTELSRHGVAMAADSATTKTNGRSLYGIQKLLPVPQINAGISIWGKGQVKNVDTDIWTQSFIIDDINSNMTLLDAANILTDKLNNTFGDVLKERMGFHLAGFDTKNDIRGPAFYHVHNGHYEMNLQFGHAIITPKEEPPIREFRVVQDRPPMIYKENQFGLTGNGDFVIVTYLRTAIQEKIETELKLKAGIVFPHPDTLSTRGEYLRFLIQTTAEIKRLSNQRLRVLLQPATAGETSIGGPITVLTISDKGIESFYSR